MATRDLPRSTSVSRAEVVEPSVEAQPTRHADGQGRAAAHDVYYPWFDWLRIVLATAVVLAHAEILTGEQSGNFPVQVFFALSGWLIGGILLRTQPTGMVRFYYLRATRIWIPYAAALALLLAVSALRDSITLKWLEFVFYKATFVYNLFGTSQLEAHAQDMPLHGTGNHFWSICAEEQFYLLAPLFLVFLPRVGRTLALWIVLLAGLVYIGQYGSISAGVLAAVAQQRFGNWHLKPVAQGLLAVIAVASAALMLAEVLPYVQTVPLLAVSIVLLSARAGTKQKVAGFLGGLSYPLYLNHWLGMYIGHAVGKRLGLSPLLDRWLIGLPLAFLISTVLFLAIDKAILARRNRWYSERLGWSMTIAAYGLMVLGLVGGAYFRGTDTAHAADSTIGASPIR